jgi:hypothetical protein
MATKKFSGIAKWAKVRKPDPEFDSYTVDLYLDPDSRAEFDESNLITKVKTDSEGQEYVKFRRYAEQVFGDEIRKFGPPPVYLKDVQTGEYHLWNDGLIGNGSRVTLIVSVFPTGRKGFGHRLERVFVEELIPYESDGSIPEVVKLPF